MVVLSLLQMTKTKLVIFVLLLIALISNYTDFSCVNGTCQGETCVCAFFPVEFFVVFVWMYVVACLIGEAALFLRKRVNKNK